MLLMAAILGVDCTAQNFWPKIFGHKHVGQIATRKEEKLLFSSYLKSSKNIIFVHYMLSN